MKSYQINDIVPDRAEPAAYHVGVFENTSDPEIEWPHRHSFYSLVWFTQGSGINVIDFDAYEIRSNRVFTLRPKQIHNWNYSVDSRGYFLLVDEPLAQQLNIDFSAPFVDVPANDCHFLKEIFERMLSADNQLAAIAYLFSLFNKPDARPGRQSHILTDFKRAVNQNLNENWTIDQYAGKLCISAETLNLVCREETG